MRKLLVLAAVLAVALVAVSSAASNAPDVKEGHYAWSGVDSSLCGFPLAVQGSVDLTTTTFFDSAGTPIRTQTLARAEGTYVGPTGLRARYDQVMNSTIDRRTAIQTVTGVTTRVIAPGVGVLLNDVGRLVLQTVPPPGVPIVLSESGQHPIWTPGAWDPVCAYLAG